MRRCYHGGFEKEHRVAEQIFIKEVAPRDGLQAQPKHLSIEQRQALIDSLALTRRHYSGVLLGNESFTPQEAAAAVASGQVDAVSFGRLYIANPDLVQRLRAGNDAFNPLDKKTIYAGEGTRGFTDYPTLEEQAAV